MDVDMGVDHPAMTPDGSQKAGMGAGQSQVTPGGEEEGEEVEKSLVPRDLRAEVGLCPVYTRFD